MEGYVVMKHDGSQVSTMYDTKKEARAEVDRLQSIEIMNGTYMPFTFKIMGVEEVEFDYEGKATCARHLVEVEGGNVP